MCVLNDGIMASFDEVQPEILLLDVNARIGIGVTATT